MTVVPFGGRTVTKDIQALGFPFEAAEKYKIKYGKLGKRSKEDHESLPEDIDLRELNKVIQLRMDEIILNVINQLKESGYSDNLEAGIFTIGGASQLMGLNEYLEEKAQMPVKRATLKRVYINNAADLLHDPAYTQVLGLLLFANENCELIEVEKHIEKIEEKQQEKQPEYIAPEPPKEEKKKKKGHTKQGVFNFFEKIQNFGGTMFNDEEEEEE